MATEFILDADTGYDPQELPPVPVRVDGKVYQARCPKDSLPVLMARLQNSEDIAQNLGQAEHLVHQILLSIFDDDDARELMDRLLDMSERRVTLAYVIHVVNLVAGHYETDLNAQYDEMGMSNPLAPAEVEPANREQRRALTKAPARKTAAKKAAPARKAVAKR